MVMIALRLSRDRIWKKDTDEYLWRRDCESRKADPFQHVIRYLESVPHVLKKGKKMYFAYFLDLKFKI